jgi:hypothetical protein
MRALIHPLYRESAMFAHNKNLLWAEAVKRFAGLRARKHGAAFA